MLTRKQLKVFGLFSAALLALAILLGAVAGDAGAESGCAAVVAADGGRHNLACVEAGGEQYVAMWDVSGVFVQTRDHGLVELGGRIGSGPDALGAAVLHGRVHIFANGVDGLYYASTPAGSVDFGGWVKFAGK